MAFNWGALVKGLVTGAAQNAQKKANMGAAGEYSSIYRGSGANSDYSSTYNPSYLKEAQQAHVPYGGVLKYYTQGGSNTSNKKNTYQPKQSSGGSGSSTRRSYSYGRSGGGGGHSGPSAAQLAQAQMDYLMKYLSSNAFTAPKQDVLRQTVADSTTKDQAAATAAYDSLDRYMGNNTQNPYAAVKVQRAAAAPTYNPYLKSQGIAGSAKIAQNPDDAGGYGAFRNVLNLLSAGQQQQNQSNRLISQQARTYSGQQIGAIDNAYLAQIAQREADAQTALDNQKREAMLQLASLIASGAKAPDLAKMGITVPPGL